MVGTLNTVSMRIIFRLKSSDDESPAFVRLLQYPSQKGEDIFH